MTPPSPPFAQRFAAARSRGPIVVTALIRGAIERRYELPAEFDDVDRQSFVRWLFEVMPTRDERYQNGPVEVWYDDWGRLLDVP